MKVEKKQNIIVPILIGAAIGFVLSFPFFYMVVFGEMLYCPDRKVKISDFSPGCKNNEGTSVGPDDWVCEDETLYKWKQSHCTSRIVFFPVIDWVDNQSDAHADAILIFIIPLYGIFYGGIIGLIVYYIKKKKRSKK